VQVILITTDFLCYRAARVLREIEFAFYCWAHCFFLFTISSNCYCNFRL